LIAVNREHLQLCASAEWAALVRDELLPWVLEDSDLGADVLEIGAGPGLVTDLLLRLAPRVTAVEVDEALAEGLRQRLAGQQVEVITADATELPLPSDRFSAAACFTMASASSTYRWMTTGEPFNALGPAAPQSRFSSISISVESPMRTAACISLPSGPGNRTSSLALKAFL